MNKKRSIKTQLSLTIAFVSLITISLISFLANYFVNMEFKSYIGEQQNQKSKEFISSMSQAYTEMSDEWNIMYIHNIGMYALYDGYIIKIYNLEGEKIWDAEECDMSLCEQVMEDVAARMKAQYPELNGKFVSEDYDLVQDGKRIGTINLSYYGPYFLSESDFQFLSSLNKILLGSAIFSLIFSVIIGWIVAKRITSPITKTIAITKQIAEGNYEVSFEGQSRTLELDALMDSINQLANALNEQEHLRKQLTADVSHELRTPLTSVATHLEAMMMGIWEPTEERLNSCHEEILRITNIVKDLERLAKVESDNFKLDKTEISIKQIIETVTANFEGELQAKNLKCTVRGNNVLAAADKERLTQMFVNLVSNAIKYTPEGGEIFVELGENAIEAIISIKDTGVGISENELGYIFERFYRTEKSRNRKTGGAGIGLTIAKSIVDAHHGSIEVISEEGKGSTFTVKIPK